MPDETAMSDDVIQLRARHDVLRSTLGARQSIDHFAHGAVGTLIGGIAAATTTTLWLDAGDSVQTLCLVLGVIAAVVLSYAAARWVLGARAIRAEASAFEELRSLRARLGIDDPRALLPV